MIHLKEFLSRRLLKPIKFGLISVAFRVSRDVNPLPAIANFNDLNQDVFLLAAYGNVAGLLLLNVALFRFIFLISVCCCCSIFHHSLHPI